jgi:hypothetical protein
MRLSSALGVAVAEEHLGTAHPKVLGVCAWGCERLSNGLDAPIGLTRAILSFGTIGHRNEDQVVLKTTPTPTSICRSTRGRSNSSTRRRTHPWGDRPRARGYRHRAGALRAALVVRSGHVRRAPASELGARGGAIGLGSGRHLTRHCCANRLIIASVQLDSS